MSDSVQRMTSHSTSSGNGSGSGTGSERRRASERRLSSYPQHESSEPLLRGEMPETRSWHPPRIKPSKMLPRLRELEEYFMDLISKGNVHGVAEFLRSHPGFNVNCQNYQGHTPLFEAVKNEDEAMVAYLLRIHGIFIQDEVLHAIQLGNHTIVELILSKESSGNYECELSRSVESVEFTEDVTPLILAAQCDNYEIIRLLLERGHTIEKPHLPTCFCKKKCKGRKKGESLTESRAKIGVFKALASPCYMAQTSDDPILIAFQLSEEMIRCAQVEKEFVNEYLVLSTQCSKFAVDLLDQCKRSEEVQILLECREGSLCHGGRPMKFPRVGLALDYNQKEFVAHSNCQQLLRTAWLDEWGDWKSLSSAGKLLRVLPRILFLPLIALIYLLFPCTSIAKSLGSPVKKFLTSTASYIVFLLILACQHEMNRANELRGPPNTGLETPLVVYIIGFIWLEMKQAWILGIKRYFSLWWNWYDILMLSLFVCAFVTWLYADLTIPKEDMYWERKYWDMYDPTLVSEGLMSMATVLAYGRILYILQVHRDLGPLQVSISRMFKDVGIFMAIFMVVMLSFTMGMSALYQYYTGHMRVDGNGRKYYQISSFVSFQATVKTLFWGIFAMSPSDAADVVIENIGGNATHPVVNKHKFTEGIGYTLFSLYHIITVIVLLNLLIAMMSDTYQKVQSNADVEWKVARTRVWLSYFEEGGTLPPPFNLIPSPKAAVDVFRWLLSMANQEKAARCSFRRCCYYDDGFDKEQFDSSYQVLMTKLIQRYLRSREEKEEHRGVALSDLEMIKHELKELKQVVVEMKQELGGRSVQDVNPLERRPSLLPDAASNVFLTIPEQ